MVRISRHFVRAEDPEKFASMLINFMGRVSLFFSLKTCLNLNLTFCGVTWFHLHTLLCSVILVKMTLPLREQFSCKFFAL